MKQIITIVGLALVLTIVWTVFSGPSENQVPEGYSQLPVKTTSPALPSDKVALADGLVVDNFIDNGETVADVVNPGHYYLAGDVGYCLADGRCPKGADVTAFSISYHVNADQFSILLLEEPLGESRLAAEMFLQERLGITPEQLCSLNATVLVPTWVNPLVQGEVGFSQCGDGLVL